MHTIIALAIGLIGIFQHPCLADEFAAGKIFLHKYAVTQFPLIVNHDFVITYMAYNGGETDVSLIQITDTYHPESFVSGEGVSADGKVVKNWEKLGAGESFRFNITVVPKITGMYESTRAKIKYNPSAVVMEDVAPDFRSGYSTSLGKIKIVTATEYERIQSASMVRLYGGISAGVIVVLALFYFISRPKRSGVRTSSASAASSKHKKSS